MLSFLQEIVWEPSCVMVEGVLVQVQKKHNISKSLQNEKYGTTTPWCSKIVRLVAFVMTTKCSIK